MCNIPGPPWHHIVLGSIDLSVFSLGRVKNVLTVLSHSELGCLLLAAEGMPSGSHHHPSMMVFRDSFIILSCPKLSVHMCYHWFILHFHSLRPPGGNHRSFCGNYRRLSKTSHCDSSWSHWLFFLFISSFHLVH